jgi:hypothetical protein
MRRSLGVVAAVAVGLLTACSSSPPGPHTATLTAAPGQSGATLNVRTGTALLKIGMANFGTGGSLVRVSTPAGDPAPHLKDTTEPGGSTAVDLSAPGASNVTVTLNTAVSWQLNLGGGTTRTSADLRGGQVTGIAFMAGSDVISLALPRPNGSVPVRLGGGASRFLVSLPTGVQARVTAAGGAGAVSLEGQEHVGVAGGSVFTTPGWVAGAAGFDVDATAGAAQLTVTARAS